MGAHFLAQPKVGRMLLRNMAGYRLPPFAAGEGRVGFGRCALIGSRQTCFAGDPGSAEPCSATGPYRESPCRAWLGTTHPPSAAGKGRAGEGVALGPSPCGFRSSPALAALPDTGVVPSHARQRGLIGKAPAEHGSALRPLPLPQARGGLGRGWLPRCPVGKTPAKQSPAQSVFAEMLRRRMRWAKCSCFTWIDLNFRQCDSGKAAGVAQGALLPSASH